MNTLRRRKLVWLGFILTVLFLVTALVMYALRQNISLFYTPVEVTQGKAPKGTLIRVGGMVEKGSLTRSKKSLHIVFRVTDYKQSLTVHYTGILPDLFREGQGVVIKGRIRPDYAFQATEVLAKHDENYMPPELKGMVGKSLDLAEKTGNKGLWFPLKAGA